MTSEVVVRVDPETAFRAFTEEIDLWWVRGPINFHDAARAVAMRCEAGVGGRLLEVYDDAAGDALELARITTWEPGARVGWLSSLDAVEIDVRFLRVDGGTRVVVEARIPDPAAVRGGTAWLRVVPPWFGDWCARRSEAAAAPPAVGRFGMSVAYAQPERAARWLERVFGLQSLAPWHAEAPAETWIEFRIDGCPLIVTQAQDAERPAAGARLVPWVFVDDLDAHFARAQAEGAVIVHGIHVHGVRAYVAQDVEGYRWTFAQAMPAMRRS